MSCNKFLLLLFLVVAVVRGSVISRHRANEVDDESIDNNEVNSDIRVVRISDRTRQKMLQTNRSPKFQEPLSSENSNELSDKQNEGSTFDVCGECKLFIVKLKAAVDDPAELETLQAELKLMCEFLSGEYKTACNNLADNLPFVLHQLEPYLNDPQLACQKIHLCPAGQGFVSTLKKLTVLTVKEKYMNYARNSTLGDIACDECLFLVGEVKKEIADPAFQAQAKQILHEACDKLASFKAECNNVVDNFLPQFFEQLEQLLNDPHAVCSEIGLCQSEDDSEIQLEIEGSRLFVASRSRDRRLRLTLTREDANRLRQLHLLSQVLKRIRTSSGDSAQCIICHDVFKALVDYLRSPDVLQYITTLTEKVCNLLPGETKEQCEDFLKQYGKAALLVIIDQLEPDTICKELHVCTDRDMQKLKRLSEEERETAECEACTAVAQILTYEIQQPAFRTELTSLAEKLCEYLPSTYQSECDAMVSQYVSTILDIIAEMKPTDICREIDMCPPAEADDDTDNSSDFVNDNEIA